MVSQCAGGGWVAQAKGRVVTDVILRGLVRAQGGIMGVNQISLDDDTLGVKLAAC